MTRPLTARAGGQRATRRGELIKDRALNVGAPMLLAKAGQGWLQQIRVAGLGRRAAREASSAGHRFVGLPR